MALDFNPTHSLVELDWIRVGLYWMLPNESVSYCGTD